MATFLSRFRQETGFDSLVQSSRDVKRLCFMRFLRLLAYGASAIILVSFLSSLQIADSEIGVFLTLTLIGDVVISFLLTLFADRIGRRRTLLVGSTLMAFSGVVFMISDTFWILLLASIFGVISPSGNEIGPFRAVEESTLAQVSAQEVRSDIFTWYNLIASAGAAIGQIVSGWLVQLLSDTAGWSLENSYRAVFGLYAAVGIAQGAATLTLSDGCEYQPAGVTATETELEMHSDIENLLSDDEENGNKSTEGEDTSEHDVTPASPSPSKVRRMLRTIIPDLSAESLPIVIRLCFLFAIDSFGSGLVSLSWLSYYFTTEFALEAGTLGTLFFVTSLLASISNLGAASLARHIGLVRTMVFTHLPSAIFLAMIGIADNVYVAMTMLILRTCTSTMDQAPRQAFLAGAVLAYERTTVMGIVNVVKTLAQSAGPSLTGYLSSVNKFWLALVAAGLLKGSYDLLLLKMFLSLETK